MFCRHIQLQTCEDTLASIISSLYISLTPPPQRKHLASGTRPPSCHLSVGVQGGSEDNVPADGQGGLLHLAPQDGVSHNAGGLPHLLQHLIQALDAADHRALLDVRELGDLCEGLGRDRGGGERRRGNFNSTNHILSLSIHKVKKGDSFYGNILVLQDTLSGVT